MKLFEVSYSYEDGEGDKNYGCVYAVAQDVGAAAELVRRKLAHLAHVDVGSVSLENDDIIAEGDNA